MGDFATDKAEILAIIKATSCDQVSYVQATTDYASLFQLARNFQNLFYQISDYITSIFNCVEDDADRVTNGAYFDKTDPITNPFIVSHSTLSLITINDTNHDELIIHNESDISLIKITGNTKLRYLLVTTNSKVGKIEIDAGSSIELVSVINFEGTYTETKIEKISGKVDNINVPQGGFDGFICPPTTSPPL